MTRLMCGHCDDVREAASYAPKEPMTMSERPRIPILHDYDIAEITDYGRKKWPDPEFVATIGTMYRRYPLRLSELREFYADLGPFLAWLAAKEAGL